MSVPKRSGYANPDMQVLKGGEKDLHRATCQESGSWFYWLCVLSLVNSIIPLLGLNFYLIFGLGITLIFDAIGAGFAEEFGVMAQILAFIPTLMVLIIFMILGFAATRGHMWAFILGMFLYAIDGAILLLFGDFLGVAVHGFVLFSLFSGLMASRNL